MAKEADSSHEELPVKLVDAVVTYPSVVKCQPINSILHADAMLPTSAFS